MILKYVLFDLDGTLTASMPGITNCAIYALAKFGIVPKTREELLPYIGPPLIYSFMTFHGLSREQAEQAVAYYRERYAEDGWRENNLFEGVSNLLCSLQRNGVRVILATSKPEVFARRILDYFDLTQYFTFVTGATMDGARLEKADVIAYIQQQYPDINATNAVMVGDRKYDVEGAHSRGLPAIGVLFGYGTREELEAARAEYIAKDIAELEEHLSAMIEI